MSRSLTHPTIRRKCKRCGKVGRHYQRRTATGLRLRRPCVRCCLKKQEKQHPLRATWKTMRTRCRAGNTRASYYGDRGIAVCTRWDDPKTGFKAFVADMGPRPLGCTLDRVDTDGDYAPTNCQWATPKEQARNRRNSAYLEVGGIVRPLAVWAERAGITRAAIRYRLKRGWAPKMAVSPSDAKHRSPRQGCTRYIKVQGVRHGS